MENVSCAEYFEILKSALDKQNLSLKNFQYPGKDLSIWVTPDATGYIKLCAYVVIIIGGLLGNLSVILTIALIKSMRNTINYYIANLAVADGLICVICMFPHALTVYTEKKFVLGEFMCKFNPFTQMACCFSSVLTLCAISCDRFMAVFRPLEVRTTEKRTSVIVIVIWAISICVSFPLFLVKKHVVLEWSNLAEPYCSEEWPIYYHRDEEKKICEKKQYIRQIYYVIVSITLFFGPILIMLTAYLRILFRLWTSRMPGEQHEAHIQAQSRSKQKVLKMVFIVLIVFILCWTPLQVTILMSAFEYGLVKSRKLVPDWYVEYKWFSFYIAYANSFLNPFIYGQYNKNFRDGFCLILHCGHRKRRTGFQGPNIFVKSIRSVSTTLSSLRSGTQAFLSRSKSKAPTETMELQPTAV